MIKYKTNRNESNNNKTEKKEHHRSSLKRIFLSGRVLSVPHKKNEFQSRNDRIPLQTKKA